ncbi:MAG: VRR-NUC domain-containing protein [Actinomycetes bacterium]
MTNETAVKRAIRAHLRGQGFVVFPLTAGMGSHPGISDLCAVRDGAVLWIECKSASGRLSRAQEQFRADIESHGGTYVLCRSVDDLAAITGGCLPLDGAT